MKVGVGDVFIHFSNEKNAYLWNGTLAVILPNIDALSVSN